MSTKTKALIDQHKIKWIDLRFTDSRGKEQHVSIPAQKIDNDFFENGTMFDGSSIAGWKNINDSDMVLIPDDESAVVDPFTNDPTLLVRCDVLEPATMQGYEKDPRSIAKRAELFLVSTGIADSVFFGPEPEFFVFDDVKWNIDISGASYAINSKEAAWASGDKIEGGNFGHRPSIKGGYFPVPPVDSLHNLRASMCQAMEAMGLEVEVHHHEVGTAGQCEIGTRFNTLRKKADEVQILKYCVQNVAHQHGKTATFMPKPVVGDNGSGMHCHQSLFKSGINIFAGDGYSGLSENALYYIGGIINHAKAINALSNASTNSYKRLVPGFEAPVMLAYSARNRSASIRIPYTSNSIARRIEVRFPDPTANPYLCFSAMLMAGIDGIKNRLDPGDAMDKDLYDLPPEEAQDIPTVAANFEEALDALDEDREFLMEGNVFSDNMIDSYIDLKQEECSRVQEITHPAEFELYYSV